MSYAPPTLPFEVSWSGVPGYTPGRGRVLASWFSSGDTVFQPIWPVLEQVGRPTLRENLRVAVHGFDAAAFTAPGVFDGEAYIAPAWDAVDGRWSGAASYTAPVGTIAATWHQSDAITVSVLGIEPTLALGEPTLIQAQFIRPTGVQAYRSGRIGVRFWWQYLPDDALNVHASWVGKAAYTAPGPAAVDGHWTLSTPEVGVAPMGWASQAFGQPAVGLFLQYLRPSPAWPGAQFGQHLAKNAADSLRPAGIASLAAGQPRIYNRNQYVRAAGNIRPTLALGVPEIYNRTRYIRPLDDKGNNSHLRMGTPAASHGVRRILPTQIANPPFGTAWASHSPRRLVQVGWDSMRMNVHVVAPTRFIRPVGTEMTLWLTRIIPEEQRTDPVGLRATVWGDHLVRTQWQVVRPQGFPLAFQGQEANRFGTSYSYNLRQIVTQSYDPEAGNVGEKWGTRPEIYLRNKTLAVFGQPMQRFGSPFVDNKARRIDVRPIAAPAVGTQFIAHGVRRVHPAGVEAQTSGEWTVVYNGARQLHPLGVSMHYVPQPERVANTRRYYDRVSLGETLAVGQAFIAPAIRTITFGFTQLIHPPQIDMPYVGLYTRHLEPRGVAVIDGTGTGYPTLEIRWNKVYPAFVLRDLFGSAAVRNLTPEYRTFGHNSAEFGTTFVRNEFERKQMQGWSATLWGRHRIMDKLQRLWPRPVDPQVISKNHVVKKLMDDPPGNQYIVLRSTDAIAPADGTNQVPQPRVVGNVLYPDTRHTNGSNIGVHTTWGTAALYNNAIKIESGIFDKYIGDVVVSLKNRTLTVDPWPDEEVFEPSFADLWPRTIWAVAEPPPGSGATEGQASTNHRPPVLPGGTGAGEVVNWHGIRGWRGGAMLGTPRVYGRADTIRPYWPWSTEGYTEFGTARIANWRQYVYAEGSKVHRMGAPRFFGGTESVAQFDAVDGMVFGEHRVAHVVPDGPLTVRVPGWVATAWGRLGEGTEIQLFNRELRPSAIQGLTMGSSRRSSSALDVDRFMRQSLWIGKPDWPFIEGSDFTLWGDTWVSYRNREVKPKGEAFTNWGPDIDNFKERLKVIRKPPPPPPAQSIQVTGFDAFAIRLPDVAPLQRFIRQDGNAFVFRQGVGSV